MYALHTLLNEIYPSLPPSLPPTLTLSLPPSLPLSLPPSLTSPSPLSESQEALRKAIPRYAKLDQRPPFTYASLIRQVSLALSL